jgi:multiple sugar transport system substrate-binding protein
MKSQWGLSATRRVTRGMAVVIAATMVVGGTVLPSHAAPAHAPVSLSLWGPFSGPDGPAMQNLVNAFNKSQSAVTVNYDRQAETNYDATLATAISGHKAPDMFVDDGNDALSGFAAAHVITPLDGQYNKFKSLTKGNYASSIWKGGVYGGKVYGIPLDVLPLTFYYNKKVFSKNHLNPNKPPTNEKQFLADAKKMTHGGTYGFVVPPGWPEQFIFPTLLAQFGGQEMNVKAKKGTVNSKAGMKALQLLHNFIYKYKISPKNAAQDQDIHMLPNGTVGMIADGPWEYTALHQALGKNLGVAAVPQWGTKRKVFLGTAYLSVYSGSSSKVHAAMTFMNYFQQHSIQWAKTGDLPAYKPVFKTKAFKALSFEKTISGMEKYGVISPQFPSYGAKVGTYIYTNIQPCLLGKKSVKSALNAAASQMTKAAQGGGE